MRMHGDTLLLPQWRLPCSLRASWHIGDRQHSVSEDEPRTYPKNDIFGAWRATALHEQHCERLSSLFDLLSSRGRFFSQARRTTHEKNSHPSSISISLLLDHYCCPAPATKMQHITAKVTEIRSSIVNDYAKTKSVRTMMVDALCAYAAATAAVQFVYVLLVGTFPFNSFLSSFICHVGLFSLGGAVYSIWESYSLSDCQPPLTPDHLAHPLHSSLTRHTVRNRSLPPPANLLGRVQVDVPRAQLRRLCLLRARALLHRLLLHGIGFCLHG